MNRSLLFMTAGAVVLASAAGCVDRNAQAQAKRTAAIVQDPVKPVTTAAPTVTTLTESIEITGDVVAGEDTTVGAKLAGRVVAVYVKDGDAVAAGQLLAKLDETQARAQLSQAQAQVGSALAGANQALAQRRQAQSTLTQAIRNARTKPEQTSAAVRQAEAQLRSARAQLQKALNGARPEERRQAESTVASARTNLETQEKELQRVETLVREGAIAGNRLDQQRAATANARNQYQNAVEALNLIRTGTRSEDIEVARAAVRQAEEGVATARASKDLDPLLRDQVEGARAQVAAAEAQYQSSQAQLQSARAQIAIAQETIADTLIRAPFAGRISGRPIQAGTIAGQQTQIARIIGGSGVYFTGQLPSTQVSRVQPGQSVTVTVDALAGRTFASTVAAVSPLGESVGRLFDIRIQLPPDPSLRPGMFARGRIVTRSVPGATVVPRRAIVTVEGKNYVYVLNGDKASRQAVTLGLEQGETIQVLGLPTNARIIVEGQQGLSEGAKVREEKDQPTASKPSAGGAQS